MDTLRSVPSYEKEMQYRFQKCLKKALKMLMKTPVGARQIQDEIWTGCNGSVNSKCVHLPFRAFVGICHLVGKPLPGVGHLSILLEAANSVLFLIFHLKYAYIDSYRHFYEDHF